MKKSITLILCLLLISSLCSGCQKGNNTPYTNKTKITVTNHPLRSPHNSEQNSTRNSTKNPPTNPNQISDPNSIFNNNTQESDIGSVTGGTSEDRYNQAIHFIKLKRYPLAISMLSNIIDYKNSRELLSQLRYLINGSYISIGPNMVGGVTKEGHVSITSNNNKKEYSTVSSWSGIQSININGAGIIQGLTTKGIIISSNQEGARVNPSLYDQVTGSIASWSNIISFRNDSAYSATGLDCFGNGYYSELTDNSYSDGTVKSDEWNHLVAFDDGEYYLAGLKEDGTVITKIKSEDYRINEVFDTSDWKDIVAISAGQSLVGLKKDGTVVVTGCMSTVKEKLSKWQDIIAVSSCGKVILGLKRNGTVISATYTPNGPNAVKNWTNIVAIKSGIEYSIGLKSDGSMIITTEYGTGKKKNPNVSAMKDLYVPSFHYLSTVSLATPTKISCFKQNQKPQELITSPPKSGSVKPPANYNLYVNEDGEVHLKDYDSFSSFNRDHTFGKFMISETWINKIPYYQFKYKNLILLCDSRGENWSIDNGTIKKKIDFQGDIINGTIIDIKDCLSTGTPQLILTSYGGGTGVLIESINIYNINNLKKYKIENYIPKLSDFVKLKVIELNKKTVTIELKFTNGKTYRKKVDAFYHDKDKYKLCFENFYSFDISKNRKLYVTHSLSSDPNTVLGDITGELVYDGSKIILNKNSLKFSKTIN